MFIVSFQHGLNVGGLQEWEVMTEERTHYPDKHSQVNVMAAPLLVLSANSQVPQVYNPSLDIAMDKKGIYPPGSKCF